MADAREYIEFHQLVMLGDEADRIEIYRFENGEDVEITGKRGKQIVRQESFSMPAEVAAQDVRDAVAQYVAAGYVVAYSHPDTDRS